jgi:hypothetical protein
LGRRHFIPRELFQEILWPNYGHSGAVARARLSLVEGSAQLTAASRPTVTPPIQRKTGTIRGGSAFIY